MAQKKKTELRQVAKILFMQGFQQKEIAVKTGISAVSVNRWAKEDHWETLKKNLVNSKSERLSELYDELAALNAAIKNQPEGQRYPDAKQAHSRRLLIRDIADLERKYNIGQTTTIARDFVMFCKDIDFEFSQKANDYFDLFITNQIERQKWQNE
jgi:transcriptional regulator with XRE-family HTH domain